MNLLVQHAAAREEFSLWSEAGRAEQRVLLEMIIKKLKKKKDLK